VAAGKARLRAGTAAAATGTGVAGITVVTVAVGELAPQSVSVLALDCSGERSQLLLIMAMTTVTITPRMPVHPRQPFGIGATPTRDTTLRYPSARFPGSKFFSSLLVTLSPGAPRSEAVMASAECLGSDLMPWTPAFGRCP
jgi:hypothetical protein